MQISFMKKLTQESAQFRYWTYVGRVSVIVLSKNSQSVAWRYKQVNTVWKSKLIEKQSINIGSKNVLVVTDDVYNSKNRGL